MYHLAPVGEHLVEVCTNVSCALVGAQRVVEAFEQELGVRVGETSEDGKVTLRTIECAGGCGYAPVVVVDHEVSRANAAGGRSRNRGGARRWLTCRRSSWPAPTSAISASLAEYQAIGGYGALEKARGMTRGR